MKFSHKKNGDKVLQYTEQNLEIYVRNIYGMVL